MIAERSFASSASFFTASPARMCVGSEYIFWVCCTLLIAPLSFLCWNISWNLPITLKTNNRLTSPIYSGILNPQSRLRSQMDGNFGGQAQSEMLNYIWLSLIVICLGAAVYSDWHDPASD